ncbi:MAG: MXAN_6640 family putative metalloprotease [Geobacteraceae bacterium]
MKRINPWLLLAALVLVPVVAQGRALDDYYLSRFDQIYGANAKRSTLSAQDDAPTERCLTPLYHGVKRDWKQLSNETRQVLAKYLAKPVLPGESVVRSNAGHFSIHFAITGSDAPPLADGDENGIPDWVETVADVLEAVYSREISVFGYRPPPTTGGGPYDVYLQDLASTSQYGYTESDIPADADSTSYTSFMVIDNDFAESIYLSGSRTPLMALQIAAAHEFQHAVQYGYNYYFDPWYAEASAAWMEDEVYDSVNQLYTYLPAYFSNTILPIDTAVSTTTGGGYGRWLFNRYINESFPSRPINREIWERLATKTSGVGDIPMLPVIDEVLASAGSSMASTFLGFAKKVFLRNWASHTGDIDLIHPLTIPNDNTYKVAGTFTVPATSLPSLYSFTYYKLLPASANPATLTIAYPRPASQAVVAFLKGANGSITEYLFATNSNTVTVPSFVSGDEIYLLICNNGTGAVNTPADPAQPIDVLPDASNPYSGPPVLVSSPPTSNDKAATGSGGGCFIATAAYGSYLHPKVMVLRAFRDNYLMTNVPGRAFVALYYRLSPPLADFIARREWLRTGCRVALTPVVLAVENKGIALFLILLAVLIPFGLRMRGELIRWDKRLTNSGKIVYSIHAKAVSNRAILRNCLINSDANTQEEEK